ncbi:hypothetical protein DVU_2977 [Nitratidesulfovibrio vulgaris str. Hildenborough]|uniref:Uncharacterized protein n=1 Tax=Nitratidesulfovibrio vulgaris (strain ATCC 29579 / DSM 644 / CCUG 34227 / NCIMB 8303 / VKM B-1760 / Hildenborough) TaxID=882 RepID=Q726X9_NITV2|nr:hypothetical protein DVU_2977 [Nitratidesulfovibrio vulgaris str. Hildenborough]
MVASSSSVLTCMLHAGTTSLPTRVLRLCQLATVASMLTGWLDALHHLVAEGRASAP